MAVAESESLRETCSPRIKRDVLFARTPRGLVFHDLRSGFEITSSNAYEFAAKIVPFFDGSHSVGDLQEAIPDALHPLLRAMVSSLLERGFARDVRSENAPPADFRTDFDRIFEQQLNYIDYYQDNSRARFMDYRRRPITVFGESEVARTAVVGLVRNGAGVLKVGRGVDMARGGKSGIAGEVEQLRARGIETLVDTLDLSSPELLWSNVAAGEVVLIAADSLSLRAIDDLLTANRPDGVKVVIAAQVRDKIQVGPLLNDDVRVQWIDAAERVANAEGASAGCEFWRELHTGLQEDRRLKPGAAISGMVGNLLAFEAFRLATKILPAETDGHVIVQDLDSMTTWTGGYLPAPNSLFSHSALVESIDSPKRLPTIDSDVFGAEYSSAVIGHDLVQPILGVWEKFDDEQFDQLPVKVGSVRPVGAHDEGASVVGYDVVNTLNARQRALEEAAIHYAYRYAVATSHRLAPGEEMSLIPESRILSLHAAPLDGSVAEAPLLGRVTGQDHPASIPAAAVFPRSAFNASGRYHRDDFGVGASDSLAGAAGEAVLSALAGRQLRRSVSAEGNAWTLDVSLANTKEITYLKEALDEYAAEFDVVEIGGAVPTVVVRFLYEGRWEWTLGYAESLALAVERALVTCVGRIQTGLASPTKWTEFDPLTLRVGSARAFEERAADVSTVTATEDVDVVAVNISTPDLVAGGVHVVRAVLLSRDEE